MKKVLLFIVTLMVSVTLVACGSKFKVEFDANGGTPTPATQTVKGGDLATAPTSPTKEDFEFGGWYDGDKRWNFRRDKVEKNLVLKAKWNVPENEEEAPTLNGLRDLNLVIGSDTHHYMLGVTATDKTDGDLTSSIEVDSSNVDVTKEGTYDVIYTVTNSQSQTTSQTVKARVSSTDTTAPFVVGLPEEYRFVLGQSNVSYITNLKAYDNVDGDVTSKIQVDTSKVNLEKEGTYNVTISVEDNKGNKFTQDVKVVVTIDIDAELANLDLGGKTIKYFSHVATDDNPFNENYDGDFKEEYKSYLQDLMDTYNFSLDFESLGDYENRQQQINTHVSSGVGSAIIRIPELDVMIDFLSANLLADFTEVSNKFQSTFGINDWQTQSGTIQDRVYGIQNKDGVIYQDLMVYNQELLFKAGITETPAELWKRGEWNFDNMEDMLERIKDSNNVDGAVPLAITPYHISMYGSAANGAEFVKQDGTLNLLNLEVTNTLAKYKAWEDLHYLLKLDYTLDEIRPGSVHDDWTKQRAVFGVSQMWQLDGFSADFEYGVVPFPQLANKTINDYYTPVGQVGDKLLVSKGSNSDDVATILYLINDFWKTKRAEEFESFKLDHPELSDVDAKAMKYVLTYVGLSDEDDIELAMDVFKFLQGDGEYDSIKNNKLAFLNGQKDYVKAVQLYIKDGGAVRNHVAAAEPTINDKIQRMLDAIEANKK